METLPAIVFALREEIRPILKESKILTEIIEKPAVYSKGELRGKPIFFCRTGIGLPAALEGCGRMFRHFRPSLILSVGYSGGTDPFLKTGDLFIPSEILSETPTDHFPTDERLRRSLELLAGEEGLSHRTGPLASLWKMAGREEKREWGKKGVLGVDMESAAVAAVALKKRIPFLSLRVIFDTLEEELNFKNPKAILQIPKFFRMNQICQRNLTRVLARFIVSSA